MRWQGLELGRQLMGAALICACQVIACACLLSWLAQDAGSSVEKAGGFGVAVATQSGSEMAVVALDGPRDRELQKAGTPGLCWCDEGIGANAAASRGEEKAAVAKLAAVGPSIQALLCKWRS